MIVRAALARSVARAAAAVERGAYEDAVRLYSRSVLLVDSDAGSDPMLLADLLNRLGVACKFAGRFDEAEVHYVRAGELVGRHAGHDCDAKATLLHNLGGLAHSRHRYAQGVEFARAGLTLRRRLHGDDHCAVAADEAALAALYEGLGENAEAEALYRHAVAIFDARGENHDAAMTRNGLGSLCQELSRYEEAEAHYEAALLQLRSEHGDTHPAMGHVLNNLATLHRRRGDDLQARALLARAHDLMVRTLGADHPVTHEIEANRRRVDATPSPYV